MTKQLFLEQNQLPGESYAGIMLGKDGEPDYHLFERPRSEQKFTFHGAIDFAKSLSTSEMTVLVPTKDEAQLVRINSANSRGRTDLHWTSTQDEIYVDYAWAQWFGYGGQSYNRKSEEFTVAFVRRVLIIQ